VGKRRARKCRAHSRGYFTRIRPESAVTGLRRGYVGLVTAVCLAELTRNIRVVETGGSRVGQLHAGYAPLYEPGLDDVLRDILAKGQDVGCTVTACDPVAATTAARLLQNSAVADDPSAGVNDVNA
jgi:UDP-N-acetyl-D-mannosaminuronate dehydrogenase